MSDSFFKEVTQDGAYAYCGAHGRHDDHRSHAFGFLPAVKWPRRTYACFGETKTYEDRKRERRRADQPTGWVVSYRRGADHKAPPKRPSAEQAKSPSSASATTTAAPGDEVRSGKVTRGRPRRQLHGRNHRSRDAHRAAIAESDQVEMFYYVCPYDPAGDEACVTCHQAFQSLRPASPWTDRLLNWHKPF